MELSKKERVLLINQYKILEGLYPEEAEEYANLREILEGGYSRHYTQCFSVLDAELTEQECEEVIQILEMHRRLIWSHEKLGNPDSIDREELKFAGFDYNDSTEYKYARYAEFYMHEIGRYEELHKENEYDDYNSHHSMINTYRRMVEVWESAEDKFDLSIEEIQRIIRS